MIYCGLKKSVKTGMENCLPYELLQLTYLRGRPNMLNITMSDMSSINRPCCVIPKIECAKFNHSSDSSKRKGLKFLLLTLQNVDRNSWENINIGINHLNSTGDFIIPTQNIVSSEIRRDRLTSEYHEELAMSMRMMWSQSTAKTLLK